MKTLSEIYTEVMSGENLKAEYFEAAENGRIEEFLKAHGCEATLGELDEFMKGAGAESGELSDDELDNVAAGKKCGTVYKDGHPVVTVANSCDFYRCKTCGRSKPEVQEDCAGNSKFAPPCHRQGAMCSGCEFCRYKGGLWLCYCKERVNN